MLQGAASFQVVATPMIGWLICSVVSPIEYRKARCGARSGPTVTCRLGKRDLSMTGRRTSSGMAELLSGEIFQGFAAP
jgi:hypothetical protein